MYIEVDLYNEYLNWSTTEIDRMEWKISDRTIKFHLYKNVRNAMRFYLNYIKATSK